VLLNRCIARANSTANARAALEGLGYGVLRTAVPRLEIYAQSFGMPIPDAEKLKRRSGCALTAMVPEDETMEVASMAGRRARVMPRRVLSEILQPRAEEICHLLWDELRKAGYEKSLNSGIVLTGGGAMLEGMPEIAEQIFDLPVRRASPEGIGGLADHVNNPAFATSVGLVVYAHRNIQSAPVHASAGAIGRLTGRLRTLFKEFF